MSALVLCGGALAAGLMGLAWATLWDAQAPDRPARRAPPRSCACGDAHRSRCGSEA